MSHLAKYSVKVYYVGSSLPARYNFTSKYIGVLLEDMATGNRTGVTKITASGVVLEFGTYKAQLLIIGAD